MHKIKYRYAYLDDGETIISSDDINNSNSKQHKYSCIGCGNELLPRALDSSYERPHFYHENKVNCSSETYLHKLAKKLIKDKFDNNDTFLIGYDATKNCSNSACKYRTSHCEEGIFHKIDLKKYYDTCSLEASVKGYIADVLLTDSKDPKKEPILIEVCVSHPSEMEKRESGLKIIEIKIINEQDIIDLRNNDIIRQTLFASKNEMHVEFISFKENILFQNKVKIQRYVYEPKQNPMGYLTDIDCDKASKKLRIGSELELNIVKKNLVVGNEFVACAWMANHKGLRRCRLCKFYYATQYEDRPKCRLSTKYGTPIYPEMTYAEQCRSYRYEERFSNLDKLDDFYIEEVTGSIINSKKEYKVILAVSKSFNNYDLFKEKFVYYLSEKMKTMSLVVITGASILTDMYINKLSMESGIDFIKEPHQANWAKYGQDAVSVSNEEMTSSADALIAFWDGRSQAIKNMLELAKKKKLKHAVVRY